MGNHVANLNLTQVTEIQTIKKWSIQKTTRSSNGTVLEAMRGVIGASLMESRIMENKISFIKNINEGNNVLMKEILRNMRKDDDIAKIKNKENEMQITSKKM